MIGNDAAITLAGSQGQFELNVRVPLIARNLLDSIKLLAAAARHARREVRQRDRAERGDARAPRRGDAGDGHRAQPAHRLRQGGRDRQGGRRLGPAAARGGDARWASTRRSSTRRSTIARWRARTTERRRRWLRQIAKAWSKSTQATSHARVWSECGGEARRRHRRRALRGIHAGDRSGPARGGTSPWSTATPSPAPPSPRTCSTRTPSPAWRSSECSTRCESEHELAFASHRLVALGHEIAGQYSRHRRVRPRTRSEADRARQGRRRHGARRGREGRSSARAWST